MITATLLAMLVVTACRQEAKKPAPSGPVPMVDADVLTMRTIRGPEKRERESRVIVAEGKVRFADELDVWRLIDLERGTVTTVDVVGESYQTISLENLAAEKRSKGAMPLPEFVKPASIVATGRTETVSGVAATEYLVSMGGYRRELWLSDRPLIHRRFLALSVGSEEMGGNYAAAMAPVHQKLMSMEGFPVKETITFPAGSVTMSLERRLEKRAKQKVARALIEIPKNFRDLSTGSGDGRPPAASPPSGPGTPGEESRSSARSEKTP